MEVVLDQVITELCCLVVAGGMVKCVQERMCLVCLPSHIAVGHLHCWSMEVTSLTICLSLKARLFDCEIVMFLPFVSAGR